MPVESAVLFLIFCHVKIKVKLTNPDHSGSNNSGLEQNIRQATGNLFIDTGN